MSAIGGIASFQMRWEFGRYREVVADFQAEAHPRTIDGVLLSKVQSVDQRMRLGMRCRLSPTADVPSHTSGAAMYARSGRSILVATGEHWQRSSFGQPGLPQPRFVSRQVFGMPIQISSRGSLGLCWRKVAATMRASSREWRKISVFGTRRGEVQKLILHATRNAQVHLPRSASS